MELRQLRYFVAVAEELHFGRAAQRLDIVQPAVSQQIGRLERELGVRLLHRTPRRVTLTGDGSRLLTEARRVLAAADRVTVVAADLAAGRAATLRLGTGPGMGERVHRAIGALRSTTPDLGLVLVDGTTAQHLTAVRSGALDAALVRGASPRAGLRATELWREPLVAVVPPDRSAAAAVPIAELAELRLRLPPRRAEPALHDTVLTACRDAGFTPELGRPITSIEDAVVEIGSGAPEWTAVYGSVPAAVLDVAAVRPLQPALSVPGQLVVLASAGEPACMAQLEAAFA
ncbi:LysR family transcriptional regulator [Pseudonocardia sp. TRM90224]|uniref:LysR family transcriptional regulator n=1 Tax=Pseudonocardia sp. TRM90224 TaxID=2812678 RepID=UPI0027E1BA2D|nr:LysR family transcriptional regulator [Pseudonocardia sp. TRM90224]